MRHLLGKADQRLRYAERQREVLAADLATATHDHQRLAEVGAALAEADVAVAEAEDAWLALSEEADG